MQTPWSVSRDTEQGGQYVDLEKQMKEIRHTVQKGFVLYLWCFDRVQGECIWMKKEKEIREKKK